ncbi:hypothetical protein OESDEN_07592 [Oesophagostomum dentatum]|uniref:SXP/RAL-2 family protein Ani s 5-like cation-binding domain-containing protein n=1 Tax=Oesophagostomum dentatum TaxID=61180 RepID=A0A0B1T4L0_OESDE|nr:hypothetical protein OESDEN_07592 [Oesophagostomum dentatum]
MNLLLLTVIIFTMPVYCSPPVFIEELQEILKKVKGKNKTLENTYLDLKSLAEDESESRQAKRNKIQKEILPGLSKDIRTQYENAKKKSQQEYEKTKKDVGILARKDSYKDVLDQILSIDDTLGISEADAKKRHKEINGYLPAFT